MMMMEREARIQQAKPRHVHRYEAPAPTVQQRKVEQRKVEPKKVEIMQSTMVEEKMAQKTQPRSSTVALTQPDTLQALNTFGFNQPKPVQKLDKVAPMKPKCMLKLKSETVKLTHAGKDVKCGSAKLQGEIVIAPQLRKYMGSHLVDMVKPTFEKVFLTIDSVYIRYKLLHTRLRCFMSILELVELDICTAIERKLTLTFINIALSRREEVINHHAKKREVSEVARRIVAENKVIIHNVVRQTIEPLYKIDSMLDQMTEAKAVAPTPTHSNGDKEGRIDMKPAAGAQEKIVEKKVVPKPHMKVGKAKHDVEFQGEDETYTRGHGHFSPIVGEWCVTIIVFGVVIGTVLLVSALL